MEVTFRYEGDARTVRVRGAVEALADTALTRGPDGIWRLALDVPDDVRTVYWLALDGAPDWNDWLTDPENPKRYVYPAGLEFTARGEVVGSLFEGPAARPHRWMVEGDVPRGEVSEREFEGRRVWFYEPPRPAEARLLLFDGQQYLTLARIATVLDNLCASGAVPPVAAVLPDSLDTASRMRDLDRDESFLELCCSVLPEAARERSVVAGASMGGRAAVWFGQQRPDLFGNVLAQSPMLFGFPPVPAGVPLRFYLDVGRLEQALWTLAQQTRDYLLGNGYEVTYAEFAGGHDFFWWGETIADGLIALLG